MARREATPEQKERAKQRREQFRQLSKIIAGMSAEQRQQFAESHPVANCEGHVLSVFNQCFLIQQRDSVSMVGGFQQWRKAGRQVKKGAVGLAIWIPIAHKKEDATPAAIPEAAALAAESMPGFFLGYVFDVTDTEETTAGEVSAAA